MSLFRFILYSLIAYFVLRLVIRLQNGSNSKQPLQPKNSQNKQKRSDELDQPKFNIEAESVDFEVVEEKKKPNEE